jgi:biopolymer transport protein ExbD
MKVPRKPRKEVEIPQASLSDISFLLLVFFLSTTTFDIKKGLGIMLPALADESQDIIKVKLKDENLAKIEISAEGKIALDGEIFTILDLETTIAERVRNNPDLVVSLKTNRKSNYKNMIEVLDHLRLAGAEKISLSTN